MIFYFCRSFLSLRSYFHSCVALHHHLQCHWKCRCAPTMQNFVEFDNVVVVVVVVVGCLFAHKMKFLHDLSFSRKYLMALLREKLFNDSNKNVNLFMAFFIIISVIKHIYCVKFFFNSFQRTLFNALLCFMGKNVDGWKEEGEVKVVFELIILYKYSTNPKFDELNQCFRINAIILTRYELLAPFVNIVFNMQILAFHREFLNNDFDYPDYPGESF